MGGLYDLLDINLSLCIKSTSGGLSLKTSTKEFRQRSRHQHRHLPFMQNRWFQGLARKTFARMQSKMIGNYLHEQMTWWHEQIMVHEQFLWLNRCYMDASAKVEYIDIDPNSPQKKGRQRDFRTQQTKKSTAPWMINRSWSTNGADAHVDCLNALLGGSMDGRISTQYQHGPITSLFQIELFPAARCWHDIIFWYRRYQDQQLRTCNEIEIHWSEEGHRSTRQIA